jgi:hypothetical protein
MRARTHPRTRLGLGLHTQLLVAGVRCITQLSVLGYILVPIFNYGHLWLVLAYAGFMVWVSAVEAIGRPVRHYQVCPVCRRGVVGGGWARRALRAAPHLACHVLFLCVARHAQGMFLHTLFIIAVCASCTLGYALLLIIGVRPWWSAQYLIPILGESGQGRASCVCHCTCWLQWRRRSRPALCQTCALHATLAHGHSPLHTVAHRHGAGQHDQRHQHRAGYRH